MSERRSANEPPRVLMFVPWYLPGNRGGGTMRSAVAVAHALRAEIDFSIVTSDRDLGEDEPYPEVRSDAWNSLVDGSRVFYSSKKGLSRAGLERLIGDEGPDLIYVNGLFSYAFSVLPLRAVRRISPRLAVLLAPRGMLDPEALAQKASRKRAFLLCSRIGGLYDDITWHASSRREAAAIRAVLGEDARTAIAMDLARPELRGFAPRVKRAGAVRLCFLSRIVRNKNLLEAIRFLRLVRPTYGVHLDIFGPAEDDAYWKQCRNEIRALPSHVTVDYHGDIGYGQISSRLTATHFLLLPTRFENFGHAILESLAAGCPVIISDRTPWRNLRGQQLGWDLPLSEPNAWIRAIEEAAAMDGEMFRTWSENAYRFAEAHVADDGALNAHRAMLLSLAGGFTASLNDREG